MNNTPMSFLVLSQEGPHMEEVGMVDVSNRTFKLNVNIGQFKLLIL